MNTHVNHDVATYCKTCAVNVLVGYDNDYSQHMYDEQFNRLHDYIVVYAGFDRRLNTYEVLRTIEHHDNNVDLNGVVFDLSLDQFETINVEDTVEAIVYAVGKSWHVIGAILSDLYGHDHTVSKGFSQGDALHVIGDKVNFDLITDEIDKLLWDVPVYLRVTITLPDGDTYELYEDMLLHDMYNYDRDEVARNLEEHFEDIKDYHVAIMNQLPEHLYG